MGPLWELTGEGYRDRDFDRGLLYWWYTTAGTFVRKAHQKAVCEQFPRLGVSRLMLTEKSARAKAVAIPGESNGCPRSPGGSQLDDDGFRGLGRIAPYVPPLGTGDRPPAFWGRFAPGHSRKSTRWSNLRRFGLTEGSWGGGYTYRGVLDLLNSDRFPRLSELNLSGTQPSNFEHASFYADPGLRRLRILSRRSDERLAISLPARTS